MNLTDQPTPESDRLQKRLYIRRCSSSNDRADLLMEDLIETESHAARFEQLARAWREVAEKYRAISANPEFEYGSVMAADEAFDTLKKQADEH